ncbi:hypothetical protein HY624_00600 [Candidatus Uhrbacteria bacterium]|nr:hypothetical protein [Candidatus Uhrbacteria bacterium]
MLFTFFRRFAPWIAIASVAIQPIVTQALNFGPIPDAGLPKNDLVDAIGGILGKGLAALGSVALVLIIYAGFLWMTAQGDPEKVTKARDILIEATIGLIIIALAWSITTYITGTNGIEGALSGVTATK